MKLSECFATPMAEFRMPEPEALCEELRVLFLEREQHPDKYRNTTMRSTQYGLFESRFDLFKWPERAVQRVAAFCHGSLFQLVCGLSDYSDEESTRLRFDYHAWFHVTRFGGFQGVHAHENASWSGIFCVDPGETLADHPLSGAVRFHDPRTSSSQHMDAGNRRLKLPFHHGAVQVRHEQGKLLMFPSHLQHEIFPYMGERPRIVIAFNSWMALLPKAGDESGTG